MKEDAVGSPEKPSEPSAGVSRAFSGLWGNDSGRILAGLGEDLYKIST